jgi:hypothetical protein
MESGTVFHFVSTPPAEVLAMAVEDADGADARSGGRDRVGGDALTGWTPDFRESLPGRRPETTLTAMRLRHRLRA